MSENTDPKQIAEQVKKILASQTDKEESDIADDAHIANDLGADSLTAAEIVLALEDTFKITIKDEDAEKIQTASDAIDLVKALTDAKGD